MKRLICLTLVVIILFCTASCKKKIYLEPDEYYVYQSGNLVEDFFGEDSYQYRFSEIQNNMLRDWCPETKRGIKIGSSVSEIAKAYKGVGFYFPIIGKPYSKDNYYKNYKKIHNRSFTEVSTYDQAEYYERSKGVYFPYKDTIIITYVTDIYKGAIPDDEILIECHEISWPDSSYSFIGYSNDGLLSMICWMIFEINEDYIVSDIIIGGTN